MDASLLIRTDLVRFIEERIAEKTDVAVFVVLLDGVRYVCKFRQKND